jgi:hypothetical protein
MSRHSKLLYVTAGLLDTLGGKSRGKRTPVNDDIMACEYRCKLGIFEHTLDLTLNAMWIADIISILNSVKFAGQFL